MTCIHELICASVQSIGLETLRVAVEENQDPIRYLTKQLPDNTVGKMIARRYIQDNWYYIAAFFEDPMALYNMLCQDEDKKPILDTIAGRAWLTLARTACYRFYFSYAWEER